MSVRVKLPEGGVIDVEKEQIPIRALLAELHINPLEVLVAKNGSIVPEDVEACAGDEIRIITVKSGG
jgi:sulfur carrier protein ThiS